MLFSWLSGKEAFANCSAKVVVFYCVPEKTNKGKTLYKEEIISKAIENGTLKFNKRTFSKMSHKPVASSNFDCGFWVQSQADLPEDTLLKIYYEAHNKYPQNAFDRKKQASFYVKLRESAAHRKIDMPLTGHQHTVFSEASIIGNFDIITSENLDKYGIFTDPRFKHLLKADNLNYLTITTLLPERMPSKVEDIRKIIVDGKVKTIKSKKVVRKIKL